MAPGRASAEELAYFERIALQNRSLARAAVPASLAEMFDRVEEIRRTLGALANPGIPGDGEGDQQEAIRRACEEDIGGGTRGRVLTVEDVIVHKLIAGRTQDRADIEAILASKVPLDEDYVEQWAAFWGVLADWRGLR